MYRRYKVQVEEKQIMAARNPKYRRVLLLSTDGGMHSNFAFKSPTEGYVHIVVRSSRHVGNVNVTTDKAYAACSVKITWKRVRHGPASNAIFALRASEANDYCENVYREGDYVVMLYCPKIDKPGVDKLNTEENLKKDVVANKLGQLALEESERFRKDAGIIESKLKEKKLDGEVQIGVAGISPGEAIVETSKKEKVNLIILGARRLGKGLQAGGTTKRYVIRNAKVPVLVCKHGEYKGDKKKARKGVKRLVVAGSDGEMHATEALKYYKDNIYKEGDFLLVTYIPVTRQVDSNSAVKALTDKTVPDLQAEREALYADDAALQKEFIDGELKIPGEVLIGPPDITAGDAILAVAEREGADLIVIGSRGLGTSAYEASDRTSDIVVNNSEVTVFVNKF